MAQSLFSSSWYRVSGLKPRLRGQARIHRQRFRQRVWYVLEDPAERPLPPALGRRQPRRGADGWPAHDGGNLGHGRPGSRRRPADPGRDDPAAVAAARRMVSCRPSCRPISPNWPSVRPRRRAPTSCRVSRTRWRCASGCGTPTASSMRRRGWSARYSRSMASSPGSRWSLSAWCSPASTGRRCRAAANGQLLNAGNLALIALAYPVVKALHEAGHAYATRYSAAACMSSA